MNYTPEQKEKWDKVIAIIQENLDGPSFRTWFQSLRLHAISGDRIYIVGESGFTLRHMQERYGSMLISTMDMVFDRKYDPEFHTVDEIDLIDEKLSASTLNDKYTFDNFVVGSSNSFAYAAALAVAESPSESYNPLFIYGGVGLGKTHLMNAVGNYVMKNDPSKNVLLMTSETITNQLIEGIARKNTSELRTKLRGVDYLMVDDIQFLAKTKATQEEFFNTFNDLRENHKQIIISSDRPPKEIPEIEERLRSRFEWGLIVDIQKPDFETRVAILKQKADTDGIEVPYEVLEYIARNVNSNIRALEGSLTSLDARSRLMGAPITMELARSALSSLVKAREERKITCELIIGVVADKYGLQPADLTGKRRSQDIALARQVAMYICREMTDSSTTAIGRAIGRDHTTVLHGCEKVEKDMGEDYGFKKRVQEIMKAVEED
ncbi:MAG: chromosomal replication initiator protein DnaA [Clostridia bacterium]|nr:chromosomal replication initiator protein DnaA [Clostridia bacterium]